MAIVPFNTLGCVSAKTKRVPKEAMEAFGRALTKWVNEAHGGNQTHASKVLGISPGHISAMMSGARGPGLNALLALREKTGLSADELLGLGPPDVDALVAKLQSTFELGTARLKAEASRMLEEARVIAAKPVRPASSTAAKKRSAK